MATLLEQEQRRLERQKKAEQAEKAAALQKRKKALQARKTTLAIRLERKNLLGEAVMKAYEAERLTPQNLAMINDLLLALPEDDRGDNWDVMAPFLAKPKAKPTPVILDDAAE